MFKGKKWLIGLCALVMAFGIASCSDKDDASSPDDGSVTSSSPADSSSEPVLNPSVTLSQETLSLDLFKTSTLSVGLQDLTGTVVWSTTDDSVVTVSDGVVKAMGMGTATITATVGAYSDSCEVTVVRGELTPEFDVLGDDVSVMRNATYELDTTMSVNGEEFDLAEVTFATTGNCLSVDENGVITALAYGTQDVTVTATYGEIVVTETFAVTVYRRASISTGITNNRLSLTPTNFAGDKTTFYSTETFQPQVDGENANVSLSYESSDTSVVAVEDNKIVAKGEGEATIIVSFTENEETTSVQIFVTVDKEAITRSVNFQAKAAGGLKQKVGTAEIDLSGKDIEVALSEVTEVYIGATKYNFSVSGNKLTVTDAPAGYNEYTLKSSRVDVTIDGLVYMGEISNKAQLLDYAANLDVYKGYAIITADIDMAGEVWNPIGWQRGTLDGQGHTISNLKTSVGVIGSQDATAMLKNVQLVNMVLNIQKETNSKGNDCTHRRGFLGAELTGGFENVLIIGKMNGAVENQALAMGCVYSTTTMNNVVIVANTDNKQIGYTGSGYYYTEGEGAKIDNVFYVCESETAFKTCNDKAKYDDSRAYKTVAELLEKENFAGFDSWTVVDGQLPYMSDYSDEQKAFDTQFVGEVALNETLTVETTLADAVISIKDGVEGATLSGNQLTLTANGIYTVVVKSASNPENYKEYPVRLIGSEALTYGAKYALTADGYTTLDLAQFSKTINVDEVLVNNVSVEFSLVGNVLKFANTAVDVQSIMVFDATAVLNYTLEVKVADYEITNQTTLKKWFGVKDTVKYAVVTQNIVCDGKDLVDWGVWDKHDMTGTLDGLGYTIENFYNYGGLMNGQNAEMMTGSAIKNITFVKAKTYSTFYPLFGRYFNGVVIENVNVDVTYEKYDMKNGGLLTNMPVAKEYKQPNDVIRNCNFNFTVPADTVDLVARIYSDANGNYGTTMENVTITSNGKIAKEGELYDFNATEKSTQAAINLKNSKWTNVKITDKTGTVTYNN
ncbi:MAG: Ig-like domain-containing protein [Clostridia bacterium]|nr:Ig-like domain-containing protein [Clostridia bacterium]